MCKQPTEFGLGAIAVAADSGGISRQEIREELTDFAQREEAGTIVKTTGTFNPLVAGSNPARPATNLVFARLAVQRRSHK